MRGTGRSVWRQHPGGRREDIDYSGASGAIDMDSAGDATAGVYDIYEFKDDAPETIDEIEVANPNE